MVARKKTDTTDADALSAKISRKAVAELFSLSRSRISHFERDGVIKADADGLFVLCVVVREVLRHFEQRKTSARLEDDAEIRKLKIAKLKTDEAIRAGNLVDFEMVGDLFQQILFKTVSLNNSLPAQFSRDTAERRRLQDMIDRNHTEIHDWLLNEDGALKQTFKKYERENAARQKR